MSVNLDLTSWIGRGAAQTEVLAAAPAGDLAALLDLQADRVRQLPPLWHWAYFHEPARQSELGEDGHPPRGGFLPPVTLPRRMFAGARLEFHRPLAVGAEVTRRGTVARVEPKQGRSGQLVLVTVRYELITADSVALVEERDLVYRDRGPATLPESGTGTVPSAAWCEDFVPDSLLLFRFSAVTFNAHRIHYDSRYATDVEGYPGLVVHGPLLAVKLSELARRHANDRRCVAFSFRARSPLFVGQSVHLRGTPEGNRVELAAYSADGRLAMSASAVFDSVLGDASEGVR